ncbi:MAG: hypothetical protein Q8O76_03905 [Chloroflexota bacterium]|nr:hypothetical protein [Chloroflexota bacterium]
MRRIEGPEVLKEPLTHQAVLQVVEEATPRLSRFLEELAGAWPP